MRGPWDQGLHISKHCRVEYSKMCFLGVHTLTGRPDDMAGSKLIACAFEGSHASLREKIGTCVCPPSEPCTACSAAASLKMVPRLRPRSDCRMVLVAGIGWSSAVLILIHTFE